MSVCVVVCVCSQHNKIEAAAAASAAPWVHVFVCSQGCVHIIG